MLGQHAAQLAQQPQSKTMKQDIQGSTSPHSSEDQPSEEVTPEVEQAELTNEEVLSMVTAQCGDAGLAKDALEAAKAPKQSPHQWADDALLWLVQRAELEPERQGMQQAMAISLEEAEAVKPSVPIVDWKTEDLLKYFDQSAFLAQLNNQGAVLLAEAAVRPALVSFLDLERKCQKWYPGQGTQVVFTDLGLQCAELLRSSRAPHFEQAASPVQQAAAKSSSLGPARSASVSAEPSRMRLRSSASPGLSSQETVQLGQQATRGRGGRSAGQTGTAQVRKTRGAPLSAAAMAAIARATGQAEPSGQNGNLQNSIPQRVRKVRPVPSEAAPAAAGPSAASAAVAGTLPSAGRAEPAKQNGSSQSHASAPEDLQPDLKVEILSKVAQFLSDQIKRLQEAVFAMPTAGGAVPTIFEQAALQAGPDDDRVDDGEVVISSMSKRRRH